MSSHKTTWNIITMTAIYIFLCSRIRTDELLCLSDTFSCRSFSMLDQLIISLLCYFSGVSWDLKSFRFSVCKGWSFHKISGEKTVMIQTYSILHELPLCVFYQHVSRNNVSLSSHIFSLQFHGQVAKEYGQNWNPKLQKQPDFPSK